MHLSTLPALAAPLGGSDQRPNTDYTKYQARRLRGTLLNRAGIDRQVLLLWLFFTPSGALVVTGATVGGWGGAARFAGATPTHTDPRQSAETPMCASRVGLTTHGPSPRHALRGWQSARPAMGMPIAASGEADVWSPGWWLRCPREGPIPPSPHGPSG